MRSGSLDTVVRVMRPGALVREGRSRVAGEPVQVAELPASILAAVGGERFSSDQNVATAPSVVELRKEPALDDLDATWFLLEVTAGVVGQRYEIKSARAHPKDPRHWWELSVMRSED